ncbi:MAG: cation:proton antiporter [Bacteroidales bacterium]|nr:cation:proton antiporter [Bacteroidales bacterium]
MFDNSYFLIILTSLLVILSYVYSAISIKAKIPSVLLLLFTGVVARIVFDRMGYELQYIQTILEFFGIVGLILIVLEGAMDLRLKRKKIWLLVRSFFSALVILLVSALSIAYVMHLFYAEFTYYVCLINAIPLAVISSAIAIPSVHGIDEDKKEFIIYESIFSDILGILFFNAVVNNPTFEVQSAVWLMSDFLIVIIVSIIVTGLILLFIEKTTMNIKFFLLIAIMVLLYAFGKMIHLSSLLMILIFGIILNNLDIISPARVSKILNIDKLQLGIERFKLITNESAFLIRTFFFFIFGFTLQLAVFSDIKIIFTGLVIVFILYSIRYLYLKLVARRNLFPELFIAPRGLITILLFYAIPPEYSKGLISEGVLFFVILITSLVMMFGLMKSDKKIPEMEIYAEDMLIEDIVETEESQQEELQN